MKRQAGNVTATEADFQRRYEPNFAWRAAVTAHLALPGLRAFWPMSAVDYQQPECTDVSGNGYDLQAAAALGNVTFAYDGLAPIAVFGGAANNYLLRADGGAGNWADVLGTETYIRAAERGLTFGGWLWWSALPGAVNYLLCKDDVGANRQYSIVLQATNDIIFRVWAGAVGVVSAATINAGWNHIVGRYDQASQDVSVFLNGVVTTNAGAGPAALADTGAPVTIGASGGATNLFTGYASMCYLCAASHSDAIIRSLFEQTRSMYGV